MSDNVLPVEDSQSPVHKGLLTGSLFYLLSAACILIGLTKILVPIFDAEGQVQEKLWSVGAINLYEVGLLAVLLVVMWRKVYDDAISLAMLVAVFLVASTVTLNVVAAQLPWIVLGLGVAGLGLCIGKLTLICRCVTGRLPMMSLLAVLILMVCNLAMPGIMGYIQSHQGTNSQLHELWFMGWGWTMVGVLLLTIAMMTGLVEPYWGEVSRPIIHSKPFRMGFVMLIVIATLGQQWAMQWAFFLKGGLPDLLLAWPVLAVMAPATVPAPAPAAARPPPAAAAAASTSLSASSVEEPEPEVEAEVEAGVETWSSAGCSGTEASTLTSVATESATCSTTSSTSSTSSSASFPVLPPAPPVMELTMEGMRSDRMPPTLLLLLLLSLSTLALAAASSTLVVSTAAATGTAAAASAASVSTDEVCASAAAAVLSTVVPTDPSASLDCTAGAAFVSPRSRCLSSTPAGSRFLGRAVVAAS